MSDDRATRIAELLSQREDHSIESMMKMQYDVYSKHAEWIMPLIRHLLPESGNGKLLREWDLVYCSDCVAASVFENVYFELVKTVFGDYGVGREVVEFILDNSELYYIGTTGSSTTSCSGRNRYGSEARRGTRSSERPWHGAWRWMPGASGTSAR